MSQFFQFETDFVESLRCIPMQVRFKLDLCGVKLKLTQWHQFSETDRQQLVATACNTEAEVKAYRELLHHLIVERTDGEAIDLPIEANPAWADRQQVAESVQAKATSLGVDIHLSQWQMLTPLQRFALMKLSRSGHENNNFLPALKEFQLS